MSALFGRKKKLVINLPDPEYQVIYLGNVLTPMAKNELDKPLALIWRTYCGHTRPDLPMALKVTAAGLKARTKQQGLTEYWAHRIVFCWAPPQYPHVFVWVYKHEGKKMKPEMRCHAVLCKRNDQPGQMAQSLQQKITTALLDYKREKLAKQNLRLSTASMGQAASGYQPRVPRRRLLLNTSGQNFRPPMARSKSAPRLCSIDEEEFEEQYEDAEPQIRLPGNIILGNYFATAAQGPARLNGLPYLARLSLDSQFSIESSDDNVLTPSTSCSSSSDDASPDLCAMPNRRRDSTFDFMRIPTEDEECAAEDTTPEFVAATSTKLIMTTSSLLLQSKNKSMMTSSFQSSAINDVNGHLIVEDDDSISDESGYHEDKLSPIANDDDDNNRKNLENAANFEDNYEIVISL